MTKRNHKKNKAKLKASPSKKQPLPEFDKYYYYKQSVQSPEADVEFLAKVYKEIRQKDAKVLREDFCGTFALCCEWVKANPRAQALGVDIDPEPIAYGRSHYLSQLSHEEQGRVTIAQSDVLSSNLPAADITCALNFSYFIFKERSRLRAYLQKAYDSLAKDGLMFLDCFGGGKCSEANEEETIDEEQGYSYFWDQDSFDPISNEAMFYIHFKRKGEKKREQVFTYDWRMWSIPEIRDILSEVGFKASYIYWEGSDKNGEGNGIFERADRGEECEAWVAYLVAAK